MSKSNNVGTLMYDWATTLFPICRSLSGPGVVETLEFFKTQLPELNIKFFESGKTAFDWTIPDEWVIRDAYVEDMDGNKVIDFKQNNLHIVGYSIAVNEEMSFETLDQHLHSLPDQPDAIPYITSYYSPHWGFCLTHNQRVELSKAPDKTYRVNIDASLKPGKIHYGELLIPGETEQEILLSTYVCHPSMANNELSGPCVAAALAQWINKLPHRHYSYRILFLVETIGSIAYLNENFETMRQQTQAGFVLSCVGDTRAYSYIESREGNTLADRTLKHVLSSQAPKHKTYSFLHRGSDERQYCAPGIDLPVVGFCRSKYGEYPEYHTSLDNLELISAEGLQGAYEIMQSCIELLEHNRNYKVNVLCEPQLGKRGLYPNLCTAESGLSVRKMMNLIAYCDGKRDLIEIADKIGVKATELVPIVKKLSKHELISAYN